MYSIDELAKIVGVSKQSLYKLFQKSPDLQKLINQDRQVDKRKIYYGDRSLAKLMEHYHPETEKNDEKKAVLPPQEDVVEALKDHIKSLENQIAQMNELLKNQTAITGQALLELSKERDQVKLLTAGATKPNFFQRIFSKRERREDH